MSDITILCVVLLVVFVTVCLFVILKMIATDITIKSQEKVVSHKVIIGWFTVFGGAAMFILGLFGLYAEQNSLDWDALFGSVGCMTMGFIITVFMLPSMSSSHCVVWTDDYIEGPNKMFGPSLAFSRKKISWKDIEKTGLTFTGYNYVQTFSGDRHYWSTY